MSWATGLIIWIVLGGLVAFIFGEIARAQSRDRERTDTDWIAERKRRLERDAYRTKMGVKR